MVRDAIGRGVGWLAENGGRDSSLSTDVKEAFEWLGIIGGGACMVLPRPQQRGLKRILPGLYCFIIIPVIGVIGLMANGSPPSVVSSTVSNSVHRTGAPYQSEQF